MKWSARKIAIVFSIAVVGLLLLGIACFVVWRIRLGNDVARQMAAIRAAGLPTNGTEDNAYYTAVPDGENAALKMEAIFALMANYSDRRSNEVATILFPSRKDVLTASQRELLAGYCAMNSNTLARVREVIKLPGSRYPIDLSQGAGTLLPHLSKLRTLARTAGFEAWLHPDDSTTAISTILGITHTLDNEPVLISKLVQFSMVTMATRLLERRLNSGSELDSRELDHLSQLFAGADETNQMAKALIGERAMYIGYFHMSYAAINRMINPDSDPLSGLAPDKDTGPVLIKLTGFFERDLRFYLESMQTNIALAEMYPKNVPIITNNQARILEAGRRNLYILSSLFLPALDVAIFREADAIAEVRTAQVALAVERFRAVHGSLPKKLNELVPQFIADIPQDPYDGQPLRYHLLKKGYVIYSVGRDGHDNNGRERPARIKSSDRTEYDITFTVER